jgi:hypothetical protein
LLGAAQGAIQGAIQGQQNPAAQMYQNIYGQAASNPTSQFFTGLMGGSVNPAMAGTEATASGQYLSGNPFFQGAFAPAAQAATQQFQKAIGDVSSAASRAGRYGSGAMQNLQGQASNQLAQQLSNTAGQLAYQNYANERQRQAAATMAAPAMAQADYQDIQNLLTAGQAREGYSGQQLQSDIARFNFLQNAPQQNLGTFLSSVYGNPLVNQGQRSTGGYQDTSGLQNFLGTAATLGGLYRNVGGASGVRNLFNAGSNFLSGFGGGSSGSFVPDPGAYAFGSNYWD